MANARNVLVVEPDPSRRVELRTRLEDLGQNVNTASSAAEALALLEWHGLPDLLITATTLSYRSGSHFLSSLRDLPFYVWTPVFQVLAPKEEHLPGVSGFLELPLTNKQLTAMLHSVDTGDDTQSVPRTRQSVGGERALMH